MLTRHGIILVGLNFDIKEPSSRLVLIGASTVSPTLVVKMENCICLFVWYVCILYMYSALFVRDAHCTLGHVVPTLAQETRLAEWLNSQGNQHKRDLKNGEEKGGTISKTVTDYLTTCYVTLPPAESWPSISVHSNYSL